jgi:hypothetical protein
MIRDVKQDELDLVIDYAYAINQMNPCKPFNKDSLEAEMMIQYTALMEHPNDRLLVAVDELNTIYGVLGLLTEPEESYLQVIGGLYTHLNYDVVTEQFIAFLQEEYPYMRLLFAYSKDNLKGIEALNMLGFHQIEDAVLYHLEDNNFLPIESQATIVPFDTVDLNETKLFYEKHYDGGYWTAERIVKDMSPWVMYHLMDDTRIKGSCFARIYNPYLAEVFGVLVEEGTNIETQIELLHAAVKECVDQEITMILLFTEDRVFGDMASQIGFHLLDTHVTFEIVLD